MFEYDESIEDKYLWNFTPAEQKRFRWEHRRLQEHMADYQEKIIGLMVQDSPAIFANYEPKPSSALSIKYTFNRLHANDPRETELYLNAQDPVAQRNNSYTEQVVWALMGNTHCRRVVLDGVRSRKTWWFSRGINDDEAACLLDLFSLKKLSELTISHYPLLTEKTYQRIADIVSEPTNQWEHLTLGNISCSEETEKRLQQMRKIQFSRIKSSRERE